MKTILLLFYYVYTITTLQLSDCFADNEFVFVCGQFNAKF